MVDLHIYSNTEKEYLLIYNAIFKSNETSAPMNFKTICLFCGYIKGQDSKNSVTCALHRAFQEGFKFAFDNIAKGDD